MAKQAVLLLAHGTPETVEQIPEYLRNVVSGRPLPQAVIEEIQHRYALIGRSPLTEITMEQARLVEAELAASGRAGSGLCGDAELAAVHPGRGAADARRWGGRGGGDLHGAAELAHQCGTLPARGGGRGGRAADRLYGGLGAASAAGGGVCGAASAGVGKLSAEAGEPVPVLFTAHSVPTTDG